MESVYQDENLEIFVETRTSTKEEDSNEGRSVWRHSSQSVRRLPKAQEEKIRLIRGKQAKSRW